MQASIDKLQMSVTISEDSNPELLAYLRQFRGARERALMLRLLAQRGLQLLASAGVDGLLVAPSRTAVPTVPAHGALHPPPAAPPPPPLAAPKANAPNAPAVAPDGATVYRLAYASTQPPPGVTDDDALSGLDLQALNNAMERFG
ncbi:hypothetical protein [Cupriavidus sp. AU9028]|uniref:hypothetical protein n=1 Tax=Cupriavidus sp. AU9028 TaxID=2871157 RepID=UPI001C972361|nr:hypothetical protein [Cupriavidus sp. AU9028]MBY4898668.1 hypothetical protein [Cupriavidus sp. AU9028]